MKDLLILFWTFCKIGAVTFGGGYAMLPILERDLCQGRGWITKEELMDYYAIGQCTPGIIAVNTAIFVGNKRKGVLGGIFAALGMVMPSFIIITIIAMFISNFAHLRPVQDALSGIRVVVCVLVVNAVVKMFKSGVVDLFTGLLCLAAFLCSVLKISPIIIVASAGLLGILAKTLVKGKKAGVAK